MICVPLEATPREKCWKQNPHSSCFPKNNTSQQIWNPCLCPLLNSCYWESESAHSAYGLIQVAASREHSSRNTQHTLHRLSPFAVLITPWISKQQHVTTSTNNQLDSSSGCNLISISFELLRGEDCQGFYSIIFAVWCLMWKLCQLATQSHFQCGLGLQRGGDLL